MGLRTNSPLQLGHMPFNIDSLQSAQKVHSKLQIIASKASKGKSLLQFSQHGLISSMAAKYKINGT
jgi:hypothetical protein